MSEGVCDMSSGVMYYEPAVRRRRVPGGLPGAAVRAGRLLELWGYRAGRQLEKPAKRVLAPRAHRVADAASERLSAPRIF